MSRRVRRPVFSHEDEKRLLEALGNAHHWTVRCSGSEQYGSSKYVKCHDVTRAIDGLAGEITGDPTHFHLKGHGTGRAANIELSKDSEESQ